MLWIAKFMLGRILKRFRRRKEEKPPTRTRRTGARGGVYLQVEEEDTLVYEFFGRDPPSKEPRFGDLRTWRKALIVAQCVIAAFLIVPFMLRFTAPLLVNTLGQGRQIYQGFRELEFLFQDAGKGEEELIPVQWPDVGLAALAEFSHTQAPETKFGPDRVGGSPDNSLAAPERQTVEEEGRIERISDTKSFDNNVRPKFWSPEGVEFEDSFVLESHQKLSELNLDIGKGDPVYPPEDPFSLKQVSRSTSSMDPEETDQEVEDGLRISSHEPVLASIVEGISDVAPEGGEAPYANPFLQTFATQPWPELGSGIEPSEAHQQVQQENSQDLGTGAPFVSGIFLHPNMPSLLRSEWVVVGNESTLNYLPILGWYRPRWVYFGESENTSPREGEGNLSGVDSRGERWHRAFVLWSPREQEINQGGVFVHPLSLLFGK